MLHPASRLYVGVLFVLICGLIGLSTYLIGIRPIERRIERIEGSLIVVQRHELQLEVPCIRSDVACRNFLSLLIANARPAQVRRLLAVAHRIRRNPTPSILRGARQVRPRVIRHHRVPGAPAPPEGVIPSGNPHTGGQGLPGRGG